MLTENDIDGFINVLVENFDELPQAVKDFLNNTEGEKACVVDNDVYPQCYIEMGDPEDCDHARGISKKEECYY